MEENTVRVNEIEEYEPETEVDEATDGSNGAAFVAGIVGGFLAYAMIGGAKKLAAFVQTKWAQRKQKEANATVVEGEVIEVGDEHNDSSEETSDN